MWYVEEDYYAQSVHNELLLHGRNTQIIPPELLDLYSQSAKEIVKNEILHEFEHQKECFSQRKV